MLLSVYRRRATRARALNNAILTNMAVPLITSDALGRITFANTQALAILKESAGSIIGQKWIRLMMSQADEGTATKLYLQFFAEDRVQQKSVTLHLASQPFQEVRGSLVCIGKEPDQVLLTTWNTDEEI